MQQADKTAVPWSAAYWDARYRHGGNSGAGSSGRLAHFKAEVVNRVVCGSDISSIIEFGCGDGRQLQLATYNATYVGVDVSPEAVRLCSERFSRDPGKRFLLADEDPGIADLTLSLDVIFHLIEDGTFHCYMEQLFARALRFVVIYSSDHDEFTRDAHVRHRCFSDWVTRHAPEWAVVADIPNPYPFDPLAPNDTSFAHFKIFSRTACGDGT
jgi:SAM-dependent methyltransferase